MTRAAVSLCVALLVSSVASGCYLAHERGRDAAIDGGGDAAPSRPLVWVLVHPSDAPLGPGLFLFDEARQEVVRRLALPEGFSSPHALAWDGHSLWLGGFAEDPAMLELDPSDGRELSRFPNVITEGVAIDGDTFWWAGTVDALTPLLHVSRDGRRLSSNTLMEAAVQDVVIANGALFYLVNDDADRIMRFDATTERATELTRGVFVAPYSLGFDGTSLAVAAEGRIRRYDPATGTLVSDGPFAVPGWITAIAFVR